MLKKASRTLMYEDVANQIINSIKEGTFKPGERLPGEAELTALFGVSRNCLREALKSLGLMGIAYSRAGHGTFVSDDVQSRFQGARLLDAIDVSKDATIPELWETRLIIEPELAGLAAVRATAEDKERLMHLTRTLSDHLDQHQEQRKQHSPTEEGISVHMSIAKIAGNLCLYRFSESIKSELAKQRLSIIYEIPDVFEKNKREHIQLCEAICAGQEEVAIAFMRQHLMRTRDMHLQYRLKEKSAKT
ncbi:MAG: FadR/GntR family transcriptional regulator [Candidatus Fimivivens sp.]